LLTIFICQVVTGLMLMATYTPSTVGAWSSVFYIQYKLTGGWFVRGLHSFGSSALIVVAGLHLLQVLLFGAYRRPRELNWMLGLCLFGLCLLFALSGYLLPWDQKGYWAKLVEATITGSAPFAGPTLQQLIQGGSAFGNLTLAHAYAAHAMLLPLLLFGLIGLHIYLARRHGLTPKWTLSSEAAAARATSFWPDQAARNAAMGTLAVVVVTIFVVARHGASLESPADPASSYLARPEWYALPLFQLRMYFDGPLEIVATMLIPGIAGGLVFALPFLDRAPTNAPAARPRVMAAAGFALLAMAALSIISLAKDARDPAYAKARAEEESRADTARLLARKGMPP
jgi:ubiquinol-cytochrome c reductase cytochrome b subunit